METIKGENNTINTRKTLQVNKKIQSDYNSCYEKTVEKIRDNENVVLDISFSSVGQNHKTLTVNLIRPQIKIPLPEEGINPAFMKINWEKCMTISMLLLSGPDQEIISAFFKTLPLEPEKKFQILKK